MAFGGRQKYGPPPVGPVPALVLLLAAVPLRTVPVSAEAAVFRLWAADHQVTGPAMAKEAGGSPLLCALHCRLRPGCRALQTSGAQCRLLDSWPQPSQLTAAEGSAVMVQLSQTNQSHACAEQLSGGACPAGWERAGRVCYKGTNQTGRWVLISEEIDFCATFHPAATLATFDSPEEFTYLQGRTEESYFLNLRRGSDAEYVMTGRCAGFWRTQWSEDEPKTDDVYAYYNADYNEIRGRRVGQHIWRDYTMCQVVP